MWQMRNRIIVIRRYRLKRPGNLRQRQSLPQNRQQPRRQQLRSPRQRLLRQNLRQQLRVLLRLNLHQPGERLLQLRLRQQRLLLRRRPSGLQDLLPVQLVQDNDLRVRLRSVALVVVLHRVADMIAVVLHHEVDMIAGVAVVTEIGTAAGICHGVVETAPGVVEAAA